MKKKKAITPNFTAEEIGKRSQKEIGKDIGSVPDEWDYKNLKVLIESYEKAYPGILRKLESDAKVELALSTRDNTYSVFNKESEGRKMMWLPQELQEVLEAAYPSLWTNKDHLHWFLKRFPQFRIPEKI